MIFGLGLSRNEVLEKKLKHLFMKTLMPLIAITSPLVTQIDVQKYKFTCAVNAGDFKA